MSINRFRGFFEFGDIEKLATFDEVDKLLEKNGVLYNHEDELDYQENHE